MGRSGLNSQSASSAIRPRLDQRELASRELEAERQALLAEAGSIEQTLTEIGARLGRQEISLARHDAGRAIR